MDGSGLTTSQDALAPIRVLCGGQARYYSEADRNYVFMEKLHFKAKSQGIVSDALLCLNYPNPTYPTKLFFPDKLVPGVNWNTSEYIMVRHWESWSEKGIPQGLPPYEILAAHLSAFK